MEEIENPVEINKNVITVGDSSNTFIDESENCIKFHVTNNLLQYDISKYKKTEIMVNNHTDAK